MLATLNSRLVSHIPSWAPGASFKRRAQGWAVTFDNMVERPFAWIKEQLVRFSYFMSQIKPSRPIQASGYIESSFVADNLREGTEDESTVKWTAASMSAAGPDTVRISLHLSRCTDPHGCCRLRGLCTPSSRPWPCIQM